MKVRVQAGEMEIVLESVLLETTTRPIRNIIIFSGIRESWPFLMKISHNKCWISSSSLP